MLTKTYSYLFVMILITCLIIQNHYIHKNDKSQSLLQSTLRDNLPALTADHFVFYHLSEDKVKESLGGAKFWYYNNRSFEVRGDITYFDFTSYDHPLKATTDVISGSFVSTQTKNSLINFSEGIDFIKIPDFASLTYDVYRGSFHNLFFSLKSQTLTTPDSFKIVGPDLELEGKGMNLTPSSFKIFENPQGYFSLPDPT
jgi:hypothetical protein